MSLRAMLWAINDSPANSPTEVAVLEALADNADERGRNSCPSRERIAWRARVSLATVKRVLPELERRGVIRRGDQSITASWRYRPVVYDLALELVRDDPFDEPDPRPERPVQPASHPAGEPDGEPVDNRDSQGAQIEPSRQEGAQIEQGGGSLVSHKPSPRTTSLTEVTQVTGPRASEAPQIDTSPSAVAALRPGYDEFGPLDPTCDDHRDVWAPPACAACGRVRPLFEAAEIQRTAARRRAASEEAIQADRRDKGRRVPSDAPEVQETLAEARERIRAAQKRPQEPSEPDAAAPEPQETP